MVLGSLTKAKCTLIIWMIFSLINLLGAAHILLYGKFWLWVLGIAGIILQVWFTLVVFAAYRDLQEVSRVNSPPEAFSARKIS